MRGDSPTGCPAREVASRRDRRPPTADAGGALAGRRNVESGVLPPDGARLPADPAGEAYVPWRSYVGVVIGLSFFSCSTRSGQPGRGVFWALFGSADRLSGDYYAQAIAFERPSGMLAANLGIATLIPVSCVSDDAVHRMRPAWLLSVQPGCAGRTSSRVSALPWSSSTASCLLSILVGVTPRSDPQAGFWGFLVVIVLTAPIQAPRKRCSSAAISCRRSAVCLLVPGSAWCVGRCLRLPPRVAEPAPVPRRLRVRPAGRCAGLADRRDRGSVAAHVVNNIFAYLVAGLTTSIAAFKAVQRDRLGRRRDRCRRVRSSSAAVALLVAVKMKPATRVRLAGLGRARVVQ